MIFILLALYQIKHYLCDYEFQTKYMFNKTNASWSFFLPLLSHATVHGFFTFCISFYFVTFPQALLLSGMDLFIHFLMDRIKAGPKYLGRFNNMTQKSFWRSLGLDQMIHHLTHYLIIFLILKYTTNN